MHINVYKKKTHFPQQNKLLVVVVVPVVVAAVVVVVVAPRVHLAQHLKQIFLSAHFETLNNGDSEGSSM